MKRAFFLAATLLTALSPVIALAITVQKNFVVTVIPSGGGSSLLPADRNASANWKMAGLQSVGGIPNRTTSCATLSPIGGGADDTSAMQAAINACGTDQVLNLAAGTFTLSSTWSGKPSFKIISAAARATRAAPPKSTPTFFEHSDIASAGI